MAIDTTKKIKRVTYNGTEIPLRGYHTSDATVTGRDVVSPKVAYGASGKVNGTMANYRAGVFTLDNTRLSTSGKNLNIKGDPPRAMAIDMNTTVQATKALSDFGNATAAVPTTFNPAALVNVFPAATSAAGSSPRPVDIAIENTDFTEVWVGYVPFDKNLASDIIPQGQRAWFSVEEGSVIVVVNTAFDGGQIDLVPDGGFITQTIGRPDVTAFIVDYSLNSKIVELLLQ